MRVQVGQSYAVIILTTLPLYIPAHQTQIVTERRSKLALNL
jgi:hypothetical protein